MKRNEAMKQKRFILAVAGTAFLFLFSNAAQAEELEMLNRPVNASGLTGLFVTTIPFTLDAGTVETAVLAFSENSNKPDFTLTEYSAVVAVGIGKAMELAVKGSFFHREEDGAAKKKRGAGDTEVSWKWNMRPLAEDSAVPAVSLFLTGVAPTGNEDQEMNRVQKWGGRMGISAGSEAAWEDHVLGMYADAQVVFQDFSNESRRDVYHLVNAGLLFPISKYRNLQLILEYNVVSGRDVLTVDGMDYTAVTSGVRLVTERFNLSMGMQLLHKEKFTSPSFPEPPDDSSRIIGILSVKF